MTRKNHTFIASRVLPVGGVVDGVEVDMEEMLPPITSRQDAGGDRGQLILVGGSDFPGHDPEMERIGAR